MFIKDMLALTSGINFLLEINMDENKYFHVKT